MAKPRKPQPSMWPASSPDKPPAAKDGGSAPPGRVVHDARGHAVWSWSERAPTDSTTHLLRKLDSPDLSLADEAAAAPVATADVGGGIDPYNKRDTVATKPAAPAKADEKPSGAVLRQLLGKR
jgi:hypothetical protein